MNPTFNLNAMILNAITGYRSGAMIRFFQVMLLPLPISFEELARRCRLPKVRLVTIVRSYHRAGLITAHSTLNRFADAVPIHGTEILRTTLVRAVLSLNEPRRSSLARKLGLMRQDDPPYVLLGLDESSVSMFIRLNTALINRVQETCKSSGKFEEKYRLRLLLEALLHGPLGKTEIFNLVGEPTQELIQTALNLNLIERDALSFKLRADMVPILLFLPKPHRQTAVDSFTRKAPKRGQRDGRPKQIGFEKYELLRRRIRPEVDGQTV